MTDKADRVKELMENPHLQEAFDSVKAHYLRKLEEAPVDSSEETLTLILDLKKMLQALDDVKATLEAAIQDGALEDFRAHEQEQNAFLGDMNGNRSNETH